MKNLYTDWSISNMNKMRKLNFTNVIIPHNFNKLKNLTSLTLYVEQPIQSRIQLFKNNFDKINNLMKLKYIETNILYSYSNFTELEVLKINMDPYYTLSSDYVKIKNLPTLKQLIIKYDKKDQYFKEQNSKK